MANSTTFVYQMNKVGGVGAWSRYVHPFETDEYCQLGDKLYIRAGDDVLVVDEDTNQDFAGHADASYFDSVIQWPWLDMGQPGVHKRMFGLDIAGTGVPEISVGYSQSDQTLFTAGFEVDADTVTGSIIPMPLTAPSFSLKITYRGEEGNFWQFNAANLYLNDVKGRK